MIAANELRLDNYLNHKELGIIRVISISSKVGDYESIFAESVNDGIDYSFNLDKNIMPILLTEEIILKCGFERSKSVRNTFKITTKSYLASFDITLYAYLDNTGIISAITLRQNKSLGDSLYDIYLHQLQNLYFALNGKELEVSL